jgi:hypothetical protein
VFKSDSILHEVNRISRAENDAPRYLMLSLSLILQVLDSAAKERMVVVGWFNRRIELSDLQGLVGGALGSNALVAVAAALVAVGTFDLLSHLGST